MSSFDRSRTPDVIFSPIRQPCLCLRLFVLVGLWTAGIRASRTGFLTRKSGIARAIGFQLGAVNPGAIRFNLSRYKCPIMPATSRRAFSALYVLSKRAFSQHVTSRSILHSKPTGPGENVRGSLEFVEWHNGGGLFHRTAHVDPSVFIEVGAVVHQKAIIGADVHIGSGSIVGPSVSVGKSTNIRYNAILSNCSVGMSCVIHNGSCIGQDGFGFFVDKEGNMMKKPQTLYVKIGDHVEIGANSCIDRGSWRDTVVGDYTKIDNLVQIGHNVVIGKYCMLCGQVGIAGSVTIGDYCTLGGRVALKDHVTISSKVRLAANSCVTKDLAEPGDYAGFPAVPIHQWRRQSATIRRLSKKDVEGSGS